MSSSGCLTTSPAVATIEVEQCPSPVEAGGIGRLEPGGIVSEYLRRVLPVICPSWFTPTD